MKCMCLINNQGPVVQSIVSLMKWLVSNSLTLSVHMKSNDAFQIASEG